MPTGQTRPSPISPAARRRGCCWLWPRAPLRKQAKEAEQLLAKLAAERSRIEATLADPSLYAAAGRATEITAANARLAAIRKEAASAEEAWLAAEEALEGAS